MKLCEEEEEFEFARMYAVKSLCLASNSVCKLYDGKHILACNTSTYIYPVNQIN